MDGSRAGASPQTRFRSDRSGQSEMIGLVLILGLVIIGTTGVVLLGSSALGGTQQQSELGRAEHSMTHFDSMAAEVALGEEGVKSTRVGSGSGTYTILPNEGTITVTHSNYDGDDVNDDGDTIDDPAVANDGDPTSTTDNDDDQVLYTGTLGAVVFENGDTEIAYQGGGVWRKTGEGSVMVSPPEFHFRGATLTLPIIHVKGEGGLKGAGTVSVQQSAASSRVYPAPSTTYPSPVDDPYDNPITTGRIYVRVQSEYYRGWGEYFEARTDGQVTYDDANNEVTLELVSVGKQGNFVMPAEGDSLNIRGLEGGHTLEEFRIDVRPDDTDSANFANLQWSMYAQDGDQQFEIHLRQDTGSACHVEATLSVYYSEDGGNTYHGWKKKGVEPADCGDFNGDGDDEIRVTVDFVDDDDGDGVSDDADESGSDISLEYQSLKQNDALHFDPQQGTLISSPTFQGHGGWEPETYSAGDLETTDRLLSHYLAIMGEEIELTVDDKNSNTVNEDASTGVIRYPGADRYVTYLHVTENEITVVID